MFEVGGSPIPVYQRVSPDGSRPHRQPDHGSCLQKASLLAECAGGYHCESLCQFVLQRKTRVAVGGVPPAVLARLDLRPTRRSLSREPSGSSPT
jgi:hypothetical protein